MGKTKISKEELKDMLNLRKQGWTISDLSKRYELSYQRVHQLVAGVLPQGICRYCGAKLSGGTICCECSRKLPLVKELVAIGNEIKRKLGR